MNDSASLLVATSAGLAAVALFAQNTVKNDRAGDTAPLVLPAVVVEGAAPPVRTSDQILTDMALKRYFTGEFDRALNRFTLPLFGRTPEERCLVRLREDQRLEQLAVLKDRIGSVAQTDPADAAGLREEMYSLSLRNDSMPAPMSITGRY